jgi:16S rRNA (guanine(527)-N(7))-methyltransferase RsmG
MATEVSKPLSEELIQRALKEFGVPLDSMQVQLIQQYISILQHWNEKLNLTAIRNPLEILYRHFCESMFAGVAVPLHKGRLADIGAGAGFPGIPLKILRPELELILIESNVKKGTFLAEVVRELRLSGARVLISRYEELGEELAPLDFVCSRALGEFATFLNWAGTREVSAQGAVLWIGGRDLAEVKSVSGWDWRAPIPVPNSLQRYLLVGEKKAQMSAV